MTEAERGLAPFFECVPLPYRGYRWFGALKLVIDPWGLLIASSLGFVTWFFTSIVVELPALVVWGIVGIISWLAFRLAQFMTDRRLSNTIDELAQDFGQKAHVPGHAPHAIAHSLGTYLTINAVRKYELELGRVVLCGSILPRDFQWEEALTEEMVANVRNEVGFHDVVPRLAALLSTVVRKLNRGSRALRHFGISGFRGFKNSHFVHSMYGQKQSCLDCGGNKEAPIHNVFLRFGHSSFFVGNLQCERHWLPYLLGYDTPEYNRFLKKCAAISEADTLQNDSRRKELENEIASTAWKWTGGKLHERILQLLSGHHPGVQQAPLQPYSWLVIGAMWTIVADAQRASRNGTDQESGWRVGSLDLLATLHYAVAQVSKMV